MAYGRISKSDGTEMALGPDGWQYMEPQQLSQLVRAPGRWEGGVDNGITVADLLARMPQGDAPNVIGGGQSQSVQFDRTSPIDYMGRKGFRQADGRIIDANGTMIADLNGAARMQAQQNALAQQDAELKRRALLADLLEKNQKVHAGTPEGMREKAKLEAEALREKLKIEAEAKSGQKDTNWTYDAGSDEYVAPPSAEYPMGRRSGNVAKTNAAKSMEYVIGQMLGAADESGKPAGNGIIDTTPQGGFLGVEGLIGRVTDSQKGKRFDNLKEQLSTEMRTLFRIPGEGALSDKEQSQYGIQLPSVYNDAETNRAILRDLQQRVKLRLDQGTNPFLRQGQPQGQPQGQQPAPASFDTLPNPADHAGQTIKDQNNGRRYKSDGKTWRPM